MGFNLRHSGASKHGQVYNLPVSLSEKELLMLYRLLLFVVICFERVYERGFEAGYDKGYDAGKAVGLEAGQSKPVIVGELPSGQEPDDAKLKGVRQFAETD
jgi:hypothetical protein